jgi:acetolactate synthase-1/3 small subunit
VTLTVDGALHPIEQVTKQLHKLVNVVIIHDLDSKQALSRELAIFKVAAVGRRRIELLQTTKIFRGTVIDARAGSVIVEVVGATDKIEAFEEMVRPFRLIETTRTGQIAILRD